MLPTVARCLALVWIVASGRTVWAMAGSGLLAPQGWASLSAWLLFGCVIFLLGSSLSSLSEGRLDPALKIVSWILFPFSLWLLASGEVGLVWIPPSLLAVATLVQLSLEWREQADGMVKPRLDRLSEPIKTVGAVMVALAVIVLAMSAFEAGFGPPTTYIVGVAVTLPVALVMVLATLQFPSRTLVAVACAAVGLTPALILSSSRLPGVGVWHYAALVLFWALVSGLAVTAPRPTARVVDSGA
jgi:hypothetical protein